MEPACAWVSCMWVFEGSEEGRGARLVHKVSRFSCLVTCPVSLPPPPALLYKPIDRVTRSTLVLHVSVSP